MTVEMAREMLAALEASGASVAAFARMHGIPKQRICYWRARLRELGLQEARRSRKRSANKATGFAAVVSKEEPTRQSPMQTLEATLSGGSRIVVHGAWDASSMREWLNAIEGKRC